ncbi:MAG: KpsF/GutQ family sugar-phosphate isomerase [Planctomycetota bacterium]
MDQPATRECGAIGARVIRHEAEAVADLARALEAELAAPFTEAIALIERCTQAGGNVLVSGLGKSGLIGAKISATLASLGVPSHAVHPTEAAHGDLGRFRSSDVAICLSNSGETEEIVNLAATLRDEGIPVISIVGSRDAASKTQLARFTDVLLALGVDEEASGDALRAPTTSTTAALALGDALAVAVAERGGFTDLDFAKRHPGGTLGALLRPVMSIIRFRVDDGMPPIAQTATVLEAQHIAAEYGRRPGALLITNATGKLVGIFTDSDLRRLVLRDATELSRPIGEVMTRSPRTLPENALVRDAVATVREHRQDEVPIVNASGQPVGILDVQDLVALRLVRPEA